MRSLWLSMQLALVVLFTECKALPELDASKLAEPACRNGDGKAMTTSVKSGVLIPDDGYLVFVPADTTESAYIAHSNEGIYVHYEESRDPGAAVGREKEKCESYSSTSPDATPDAKNDVFFYGGYRSLKFCNADEATYSNSSLGLTLRGKEWILLCDFTIPAQGAATTKEPSAETNTSQMVGMVFGGLAAALGIAFAVFIWRKRKQRRHQSNKGSVLKNLQQTSTAAPEAEAAIKMEPLDSPSRSSSSSTARPHNPPLSKQPSSLPASSSGTPALAPATAPAPNATPRALSSLSLHRVSDQSMTQARLRSISSQARGPPPAATLTLRPSQSKMSVTRQSKPKLHIQAGLGGRYDKSKNTALIRDLVLFLASPEALAYMGTTCDAPFRSTLHKPSVEQLDDLWTGRQGQLQGFNEIPAALKDQLPNLLKSYVHFSQHGFGRGDAAADEALATICDAIIKGKRSFKDLENMKIAFAPIGQIEQTYERMFG